MTTGTSPRVLVISGARAAALTTGDALPDLVAGLRCTECACQAVEQALQATAR